MVSLMLAETRSTPALVEAALREDVALYAELGHALRARRPNFAATVARGSSDHAAAYASSLFAIAAGCVTATLSPSLVTRYGARLRLSDAVVLGVSQSGASPDLVRVMQAARAASAMTIAMVNAPTSRLAAEAEWTLPLRAGPEQAVAATKSFILSLVAIARLTAAWTEDEELQTALSSLPDRLDSALGCDWSVGIDLLATAVGGFVVSRGPCLAVAQEAALKLKETSYLHAEAVSAAEIRHGPRAVLDATFPVLGIALDDPGGIDTLQFARELVGGPVLLASPHGGLAGAVNLKLPAPLHPLLDPIVATLAFYPFAEALARARGHDPDHPRGLLKVTETV